MFDEIITGFRVHLGGAQARYGVTPDCCSSGKSMGNGMPISAVVGRTDLMAEMEHIFFSSTFGGEALSLAAAITGKKDAGAQRDRGTLEEGRGACRRSAPADRAPQPLRSHCREWAPVLDPAGFSDAANSGAEAVKTLLMIEMLSRGVLSAGSHNVCYAHDAADIKYALELL